MLTTRRRADPHAGGELWTRIKGGDSIHPRRVREETTVILNVR